MNKLPEEILDDYISSLIIKIQNEYGIYQNLSFPEFRGVAFDRNCEQRWNLIENYIQECESMVDFGSNMGYFVFKSQEKGLYSIGIDNYWEFISLSQSLMQKYLIQNTSFMFADINYNNIKKLHNFDCVVCFSIFHHFIQKYGFIETKNIMQLISDKTKKFLFFETGQPNEKTDFIWKSKLEFMGNNPYKWIEKFLLSLKFNKVILLGEIDTHISNIKRGLFVAIK